MLFSAPPIFRFAAPITPGDTTAANIPGNAKGIWVGGAGAVTALLSDNTTVLFSAIPAGTLLPIEVVRVNSTGTTATLLVGLQF